MDVKLLQCQNTTQHVQPPIAQAPLLKAKVDSSVSVRTKTFTSSKF